MKVSPPEVKEEPLEAVPYNNSKYFKKQRIAAPAVTNTLPAATETVHANNGSFPANNEFRGRYFETPQDVIKSELNANSEPVPASNVPGSEHDATDPSIVIKSGPVEPAQKGSGQEGKVHEFGAKEEGLVEQYNSVRAWRHTGRGKDISSATKSPYAVG